MNITISIHLLVQRVFPLLVLMTAVFTSSCSRSSLPPGSALQMVNGSIPASSHPATWSAVALIDKKSSEFFCSGTIIADNLVVTAAHCVFDKKPEEFQVLFGADIKALASVVRDVEARETFKPLQKYESNFDIAWVRFTGGLPQGFHAVEIWQQPELLQPGTSISIAGYGRTSSLCDFSDPSCQGGTLLFVDTQIREFVDQGRLFNLIVVGPRKDHGPCFGDSGGPAYIQKDGQWYVIGDFMGWDRILVSEEMDTICDTGEAIYNFVGEFAQWIEDSSGVTLVYDKNRNPRQPTTGLDVLTAEPNNFQGWCAYNNHEDPAWFTVQRLIRSVSDFRIQKGEPSGAREIFENCQTAEVWLRRMIQEQPTLRIAGFDPVNFIDSARLEDIRPLKVLGDMGLKELILTDHAILDFSPLNALVHLKKLEIVDNVIADPQQLIDKTALSLAAFPELESLHLQNTGARIDFHGIDRLKKLRSLDLAYLDLNNLQGLEALSLEDLRLDTTVTQGGIDLSSMSRLRSLYLSKILLLGLPTQMNALESLELLEVTNLKALPLRADSMKRLFIYASDWSGDVKLNPWPQLEDVSIYRNLFIKNLSGLSNFPNLRYLDISENTLESLGEISQLPSLEILTLTQNALKSLPALKGLTNLEKLDIDSNQISSIQNLVDLPKLEYLNVSHNPLQNLEGISHLPGLKRLVMQNEPGQGLRSLQGLRDLPQLTELNVSRNSLYDFSDILPFAELEVLIINDNLFEDLHPLKVLSKLEYIEAVNNPLKERYCPIAEKPEACRFEWLYFSGAEPIDFGGIGPGL